MKLRRGKRQRIGSMLLMTGKNAAGDVIWERTADMVITIGEKDQSYTIVKPTLCTTGEPTGFISLCLSLKIHGVVSFLSRVENLAMDNG